MRLTENQLRSVIKRIVSEQVRTSSPESEMSPVEFVTGKSIDGVFEHLCDLPKSKRMKFLKGLSDEYIARMGQHMFGDRYLTRKELADNATQHAAPTSAYGY